MLSDEEQPLPPDYQVILKNYVRTVYRLAGSPFLGAYEGRYPQEKDGKATLRRIVEEVLREETR